MFFDNSATSNEFEKANGNLMHAIQSNLVRNKILTATFVNFLVTLLLTQELNLRNQVCLFMHWYLSFNVTGQTKMVMKDRSR